MDIGRVNFDGEWLELEAEDEEFGSLKVLVLPESLTGIPYLWNGDLLGYISSVVMDWDLMDGEKRVPYDDENKRKYLSILSRIRIKNPKYTKPEIRVKTFGSEIIAFSQNLKNFIKN